MRFYVHKTQTLKFHLLQLLQAFLFAQTHLAEYGITVSPTILTKCKR